MTQPGVQKGRFWVTEPGATNTNTTSPTHVHDSGNVNTDAHNSSNKIETDRNTVLNTSSQDQTSGTGSTTAYQKGRFLVVQNDKDRNKSPIDGVSGTGIEKEASISLSRQDNQGQDARNKIDNSGTGGSTYQKGRFLIVNNEKGAANVGIDSSETSTNYQESNKNTFQKGRFLVKKVDNVDTSDAHNEHAVESIGDFNNANKRQILKKTDSASSLGVNQPSALNAPLPPVSAKVAGQPQQKTIASELQRISNQNHKLHHMLRCIIKAQGIEVPPASSSKGASVAPNSATDSNLKPRASSSSSNIGGNSLSSINPSMIGSTNAPKQHIAAAADPHRLQDICSELTLGSQNLIMEYNALKAKNHVLTKQLHDTKTQLKEMTLNCENLKAQVATLKQNS